MQDPEAEGVPGKYVFPLCPSPRNAEPSAHAQGGAGSARAQRVGPEQSQASLTL